MVVVTEEAVEVVSVTGVAEEVATIEAAEEATSREVVGEAATIEVEEVGASIEEAEGAATIEEVEEAVDMVAAGQVEGVTMVVVEARIVEDIEEEAQEANERKLVN